MLTAKFNTWDEPGQDGFKTSITAYADDDQNPERGRSEQEKSYRSACADQVQHASPFTATQGCEKPKLCIAKSAT